MKFSPLAADCRHHLLWVSKNKETVLYDDVNASSAINFLLGFNAATGYSLFRGFEEWLIVESGVPENFALHWRGLLLVAVGNNDEDDQIVDEIFDVVDRFLQDVEDPEKIRAWYRRFDEMRAEVGLD